MSDSNFSCPTCGSDDMVHKEYTRCRECGENHGGKQYTGDHLRKELRELVEQWREEVEDEPLLNSGQKYIVRICANELEAIVDD